MSDSKKLIKNTTIYALGDIVPRLLGFISIPVLTRYLLPADYGIINYVNTLITFLLVVGFLCTNTYYLVHYYRCENETAQKKLLGNLFTFIIGFNIVVLVFLLIFGKFIFSYLSKNISFYPYIIIAILTNFFNLFSVLPSALYRLLEKPMLLTIINIADALISLILTLILVIHFHFSALGALYAGLVVNFIFSFVFLYTIRNHIIWNFNFDQIKTVLMFSLPLVPGSLAYYVTSISDRILIDKYLNLTDLGLYGTASSLALVLNIFSFGAYKSFEPFIFKNWGNETFLKTFEIIRNGFIYVLLVGTVAISVFSKEFFQIMTNVKFHFAYWYVPMIIIGVYTSSVSLLYGTSITANGKTRLSSVINIITAAVSVALNILLLPKYGLITAALVSSFAMTGKLFSVIWYSKLKVERFRPILSVVVTSVSVYILVYIVDIEKIIYSILFKGFITIIIFFILSLILSVNPFKMISGLKRKNNF